MGHHVLAIIGAKETIIRIYREFPALVPVTLRQGFSMIPVSAELVDSIVPVTSNIIETDYHGGTGGQGAIVLHDGKAIMESESRDAGPINAALKLLGVKCPIPLISDEFAAVGLDQFRSNEKWLEAGGVA